MELLKRRFNPFHRIGDVYGHLFDGEHFLGRSPFEDSWMAMPKANAFADESEYQMEIELPGYSKDQVEVTIENGILKIATEEKSNKGEFLVKEFPEGKRRRVFILSKDINQDKISARLSNGILKIILPKNNGSLSEIKKIDIN